MPTSTELQGVPAIDDPGLMAAYGVVTVVKGWDGLMSLDWYEGLSRLEDLLRQRLKATRESGIQARLVLRWLLATNALGDENRQELLEIARIIGLPADDIEVGSEKPAQTAGADLDRARTYLDYALEDRDHMPSGAAGWVSQARQALGDKK